MGMPATLHRPTEGLPPAWRGRQGIHSAAVWAINAPKITNVKASRKTADKCDRHVRSARAVGHQSAQSHATLPGQHKAGYLAVVSRAQP